MILSVDDGCASDVRIADLAQKYEVSTIFYWPVEWHSLAYEKGYKPLSYDQAYDIAKSHEIGSHSITHRHLTKISQDEALKEIGLSKIMLFALFNKEITKFAPPRGYTNEYLTERTLNLYGSQRLTRGENLVHVHPNSGANNNRPWQNVAREKIADGIDIELWGHSWEWDRFDLWDQIERFFNEYAHS